MAHLPTCDAATMFTALWILSAHVWAGPPVLVEVDLGPLDPAPVAEVASASERVELGCRDDGQGADVQANDAVHTCAGESPEGAQRLTVRWSGGQQTLEQSIPSALSLRLGPEGFGPLQPRVAVQAPTQAPPQGGAPGGGGAPRGGGSPWWGLIPGLLVAAGVGGWLWPKGLRGAQWTAPRTVRPSASPEEIWAQARGPVLLSEALPLPGPALVSEGPDVDQLLGTLRQLRAAHPGAPLTLLIVDSAKLTAPGEIGLGALERLERDAPAGTTLMIWEP